MQQRHMLVDRALSDAGKLADRVGTVGTVAAAGAAVVAVGAVGN
jgi:hypothetical protein